MKDIREKENSVKKLRERKGRKAMLGSEAILCVLVVHLLLAAGEPNFPIFQPNFLCFCKLSDFLFLVGDLPPIFMRTF